MYGTRLALHPRRWHRPRVTADTLGALALFIGIIVGTYSTIFVAAPFYSQLREGESGIRKHTQRVLAVRAKAKPVEAGTTVE